MTTKHCRHRHLPKIGTSAAVVAGLQSYSPETRAAMAAQASSLQSGAEGKSALAPLCGTRGDLSKSYADLEKAENRRDQQEQQMEEYNRPLTRDLESIFDHLDLPALPSPLPKAIADSERAPWGTFINEEVSPWTTACQEGSLETVRYWVTEQRNLLGQIGLQHGLSLAAWKDHTSIVRYLLSEGGAYLDSAVVEMACRNLSLPMFQVAIEYGYLPDQQMPSSQGRLGTALIRCLDSPLVTGFLLAHGANPDVGPWQDFRRHPWRGMRAAPPMDRQCGLALDLAIRKGNLEVAEKLLGSGAHVNYARPVHELIKRGIDDGSGEKEQEWKDFMELMCRHSVDVNADQACHGPAPWRVLHFAVHMGQWGIVEELLVRGADPYFESRPGGKDAFQVAGENVTRRSKMAASSSDGMIPSPAESSKRVLQPADDSEFFMDIYKRVKERESE